MHSHSFHIRSLSPMSEMRDLIRNHEAKLATMTYDMESPRHQKHSSSVSEIGPEILL
jgi:hypothetical protein